MLINQDLVQEIYLDAGLPRMARAQQYINQGKVRIIKSNYENPDNFSIKSIVEGNFDDYTVEIDVKNGELENLSCECQDYLENYSSCKHIIATLKKFEQTKFWSNEEEEIKHTLSNIKNNNYKYKSFNSLINSFYNEELNKISADEINMPNLNKVKIETKMEYDKFSSNLKLEFKIGNSRMYKLKDLPTSI